MAAPPEDPLHWKLSVRSPTPTGEQQDGSPARRISREENMQITARDLQSSRSPTPLQLMHDTRSSTPSACIHALTNPPAKSTALETFARSASAMSGRSPRSVTPTTAMPSRQSGRAPSANDTDNEDEETARLRESEFLHKVIFRRPLEHPAVADDLRPTRSKASFNGIMQATTQPESELLLSISKGFASAAHQGALQRVPYGAPPRMPFESITPPAQMAAPAIRPHNAWCTFVTWVPPADGSDHDEFTYELNLRIVGEENSLLVTGIGQEPQVQLNGLESGKTYEFQVRACNTMGSGEWSHWSDGYVVPHPLQIVPRNDYGELIEPLSSSECPHSIKLEWDEPCSQGAPIIGYRIQYSLDPSDEGASETITSLHRRTNLVVSDLKPSHLYFFRVQALNEVGCSEWTVWSDGIATKVVGPEIPDAPTLVQAKPRDLTITWSEPHTCGFRLIGYDVKVSREDPSMKEALILAGDELVVRTHQLQLSDLEPLHDYYFQVRAVANTGTSGWSEVSGPFKTCMSAPEPCTELQVTANQLRQVGLSFQTPDTHRLPIQNFMVRWLEKGEDYLLPEELGRYEVPMEPAMMDIGTPVNCTVPGIPPGLRLFFQVAAVTEAGIGPFSNSTEEVKCYPDKPGEPQPPSCKERTKTTFIMEVEDKAENHGSIVFRYELRYDFDPQMLNPVLVAGPMACSRQAGPYGCRIFQHVVNGLQKRGPYYFQSRCWNAAGPSRWSPLSVPLLLLVSEPARLAAVTLVEADSCESLIVEYRQAGDLGATFGGGVDEYELRYARKEAYLDDPDAGQLAPAAGHSPHQVSLMRWPAPPHGEQPPVRVAGLITGRKYVFQVRAVSAFGHGPWSFVSDKFQTLPSRPERPEAINVEKGALNPFSAKLKMFLPEANGSPVTGCRLLYLGPNWTNRPVATEWKELKIIEFDDCEIQKLPVEDPDFATDPFVHIWEFTVLHLEPGASYRFKFSCLNAIGESEMSDVSNVVTTMPTVPDKCTAPYLASEEDAEPYRVTFHWQEPHHGGSDIQFYTLMWASNIRFQGYKVVENITETHYCLDNMEPNMKFYLRIAATNGVGQGKFSDCIPHLAQGVIATIPRVPSVVPSLQGEPIKEKGGAVHLSWAKPEQDGGCMITRYRVSFSEYEDFSSSREVYLKAMRDANLYELKPEALYYFKVSAVNAVGQGEYSEPATVVTNPMPPEKFIRPRTPEPPQVEVKEAEDGGHSLTVRWSIPETYDNRVGFIYDQEKQTHMITHYSIYLQGGYPSPDVNEHEELREDFPQARTKKTVPKNGHNVTEFAGLVPGRYYHATVKAFSAAGESDWSLPSEVVRSPPGRPDPVREVNVTDTTHSTVSIAWPSPSGNGECVVGFHVRWREIRVLRGWNNGKPACPADSDETAGQYEEVNQWLAEAEVPFYDAVATEAEKEVSPSHRRLSRRSSVIGGVVHEYVITGLQPASFYDVQVVAKNNEGLSEPAITGEVRTRSTVPGVPSHCLGQPEAATINDVSFHWIAPRYLGGENLLGYEVRWIPNTVGYDVPTSSDPFFAEGVTEVVLGPDCREWVAKGLHPGDAALPIVRAYNEIGYSEWSRMPIQEEVEALSSKPDTPEAMTTPPRIERTVNFLDHRPYSLKVAWECPDLMGRPIQFFKLRLFRADTEDDLKAIREAGKVPPPPPSDEPLEFTVERPKDRDWQMGETIQLVNLHQGMIPGTPYIAYVRATSEVGDAKGWGVPSASHLAPADYPSKPEPPTCPWQWPTALEVHWTEPWTQGSDLESVEFIYSKWEDHSQNAFKVPDDVVHQTFDEKQIHVAALEYATTYYFKYRVKNAVGWSEWSEISQGFITGACRPAPPKKPELEHIDMEQLIFKWNRPNSHGCPIDRYEVFLADQDRVAKVKKLVDDLNECSTSEEQKVLLDDLPVKDFHEIKVEEFANPALPDHIFEGLLGGLPYAVAVRAHNLEGWSDWSPPLDDIVSPTAAPEEPPAPWLIEAGKDSLHVGFSLPYDNGDIITKAEVAWFRLAGPMERHIALGGKVTVPAQAHKKEDEEGDATVDIPPEVERAKPEDYGGSWEALLTGLAPGTEYEVQVTCINSHGNGPYSIGMIMVSSAGVPDMPGKIRHANSIAKAPVEEDEFAALAIAGGGFDRGISNFSNLSDLEAPPTPHSSEDEESDGAMQTVPENEEVLLPPSATAGGAVFFTRTHMLQSPDEVVSLGSQTRRRNRWNFLSAFGSSKKVQPFEPVEDVGEDD